VESPISGTSPVEWWAAEKPDESRPLPPANSPEFLGKNRPKTGKATFLTFSGRNVAKYLHRL